MRKLIYLLLLATAACRADAQMTARVVADGLYIPWEIIYGPDDHIWFTQKNGYICRMEPVTGVIDTLYHETNSQEQGEGGMLGMALHPNFPSPPFVYVVYNYMQGGNYRERVVKYQYSGNALSNPQTVIENIDASSVHNGSRLVMIGDILYITTGDAADQTQPQNINNVNGKVLRLVQDGSVPLDNPIPGNPVWSWGHRNAQGMVFANGMLYATEHGPASDDEVNIITKGGNYGWPNVHGFCNLPAEQTFCNDSNVVEPLRAWSPTLAVCGLDYYNHPMFPALQNSLLMTTLKDQTLYQLTLNSLGNDITAVTAIPNISYGRLRDICISPTGKIYLSTSNGNDDKIIELYDPAFNNVANVKGSVAFSMHPNPATTEVYITTQARGTVTYEIHDVQGRKLSEGNLQRNVPVQVGHLPAGVYSMRLTTAEGHTSTQKLVRR